MRAVLASSLVCLLAAQAAQANEIRSTVPLTDNWRFHQGDLPGLPQGGPAQGGSAQGGSGDASWAPVSVPHTWNRVGYYLPNPEGRPNRKETVNKYQGPAWYRLDFTPPAGFTGKRAWLQFDAVSRLAEVWLNGKRLGNHAGGFSRFRLDATAALEPGKPNVLLVRVDNSNPSANSSTADNLPLRGDFFIHGGIYRPVSLIATDPVHVDMLDSGGPGLYGTTQKLTADEALVDVRARLRNDGARPAKVTARLRLLDHTGKPVAEETRQVALGAASGSEVAATLRVARPHLWDGTADPYLHRLVIDLLAPGGAVLDSQEQPFGIREVRVDPDRGFFLNGKPLRLKGVGYHQDREGKGTAVPAADVEEDVRIMREMGVNSIRLTHYQHGQTIHDLADKYGLILWDEIPLVSAWTIGSPVPTAGLREGARQQLRELIRQNQNHPSVVTWGIANEVDFGNSLPGFLVSYEGKSVLPDPLPLLNELNALAKETDPSRPTALATCCEGRLFAAGVEVPVVAQAADLGGANRYFGWYFGTPEDLGPNLEALRAKRPNQPLSVTEYGAGGALTIHTDNVLGGPIDSRGRAQPEEYESYIHERNWETLAAKPYLWGTWLWNSFDFATTVRSEGDAQDINTKGLVTYDRQVRKDAYYFYKANWTDTPTVHITGRRYADRAYAVTPVRVYSNAARTELLLNGTSLGVRENCAQRACEWAEVRLVPGANRLVARAVGSAAAEDAVEWTLGAEAARSVRIDSGTLVAGTAQGKRFGSDSFFTGGKAGTIDVAANYGAAPQRPAIAGTPDRDVAATYREGTFAYEVPLADGRHTVTLTFIEPSDKPAPRRFDVFADGRKVIAGLDVAAAAGAPRTAVTRQVRVKVRGGRLALRFVPIEGQAIVSAVEIAPE